MIPQTPPLKLSGTPGGWSSHSRKPFPWGFISLGYRFAVKGRLRDLSPGMEVLAPGREDLKKKQKN